jgi:threonine/homoserine/homoserine lactone efflux protein
MELTCTYIDQILMLMAIHLSAAISPGPSVVFVAHTSAFVSRKAGVIAATAMGFGAWFWATAALFGMHDLLTTNRNIFEALKFFGAGFLFWTGMKMMRKSKSFTGSSAKTYRSQVFFHALKFQLTNPKVVIFFGAIFLAVFPPEIPMLVKALILAIIFINETLWYTLLAFAFSFPFVQKLFQRWQNAIR